MKRPQQSIWFAVWLMSLVVASPAQTTSPKPEAADPDAAAIRQTALDYIEGWYNGDAERMERALHPELAKRIIHTDPKSGRSRFDHMSALALIQGTRRRSGQPTPKDRQQKDVTILDVFGGAASVKVVAADWVDYLHVGKVNGRWVIVNVLWELKPEKK
jgi:Putative lumazine-binding